jgi:hypothetical protein
LSPPPGLFWSSLPSLDSVAVPSGYEFPIHRSASLGLAAQVSAVCVFCCFSSSMPPGVFPVRTSRVLPTQVWSLHFVVSSSAFHRFCFRGRGLLSLRPACLVRCYRPRLWFFCFCHPDSDFSFLITFFVRSLLPRKLADQNSSFRTGVA